MSIPSVLWADGATPPLPDLKDFPGWTQQGDIKRYDPDNLFEYIDGDAETYFAYGFEGLVVGKYANPAQGLSVTLDVYDMAKPIWAFGVYANGRSPEVRFVDVGAQGYFGEESLDFWKGRYFVHITAKGQTAASEKAMLSFGRAVASKISGEVGEPPESRILPREGLIANTLKYQRQNVLGQSLISNALMADYEVKGARVQLVVAQLPSEQAAVSGLAALKKYVQEAGAIKQEIDGGFFGSDPYYKNMLATTCGVYLVCVLRTPDLPTAQALVSAFQAQCKR